MYAKTSDVNKIYTFFYYFIFTDYIMCKLGYKFDVMIYNLAIIELKENAHP